MKLTDFMREGKAGDGVAAEQSRDFAEYLLWVAPKGVAVECPTRDDAIRGTKWYAAHYPGKTVAVLQSVGFAFVAPEATFADGRPEQESAGYPESPGLPTADRNDQPRYEGGARQRDKPNHPQPTVYPLSEWFLWAPPRGGVEECPDEDYARSAAEAFAAGRPGVTVAVYQCVGYAFCPPRTDVQFVERRSGVGAPTRESRGWPIDERQRLGYPDVAHDLVGPEASR